jgi:hypothetical protein
MYQIQYLLPKDNLVEKGTQPAGAYTATITGLTSSASVLVEGWNGSAWTTLATILKAASGKIGATAITIPASGRVRCSLVSGVSPNQVKIRINK